MYLQSRARRVRSPSPLDDSSTESGLERELMKTPKSHKSTPRGKWKSTPIRKPRVTAVEVDRKLRKYVDDRAAMDCRPAPSATVSVPPRDSVSTFIQDLETNIRSKVKTSFHDDLFHEINTTVLSYKKKQPEQPTRIINIEDLQGYNPRLEYHITQQQQQPLRSVHLITNAHAPVLEPEPPLQPPPPPQQQQPPPPPQQQQVQQQDLPQGIALDLGIRLQADEEDLETESAEEMNGDERIVHVYDDNSLNLESHIFK